MALQDTLFPVGVELPAAERAAACGAFTGDDRGDEEPGSDEERRNSSSWDDGRGGARGRKGANASFVGFGAEEEESDEERMRL